MTDASVRSEQLDAAIDWFVRLQDCDDEAEWNAHRTWIEADPANSAAYARVESSWIAAEDPELRDLFAGMATPQVSEALAPADDLADRRATRAARSRLWTWVPVLAAACLAAVIALPIVTRLAPVPGVTYRTDATHAQRITLADGSRITLNRDSALTANVDGGARSVTLASGEAAFDIRHDQAHPFTVSVAGREVRVLGTAFGVTSRDGAFGVAVLRGAVSVSVEDDPRESVVLPAGKALSRLRGSARDQVVDVAPENALVWSNGELSYATATLATLAADYERMIGEPVAVDPSIRDLPISGIFRARNEAQLVRQIELVFPVTVVRTASGRRIMRRGGT